jgi:hypothetical protein
MNGAAGPPHEKECQHRWQKVKIHEPRFPNVLKINGDGEPRERVTTADGEIKRRADVLSVNKYSMPHEVRLRRNTSGNNTPAAGEGVESCGHAAVHAQIDAHYFITHCLLTKGQAGHMQAGWFFKIELCCVRADRPVYISPQHTDTERSGHTQVNNPGNEPRIVPFPNPSSSTSKAIHSRHIQVRAAVHREEYRLSRSW